MGRGTYESHFFARSNGVSRGAMVMKPGRLQGLVEDGARKSRSSESGQGSEERGNDNRRRQNAVFALMVCCLSRNVQSIEITGQHKRTTRSWELGAGEQLTHCLHPQFDYDKHLLDYQFSHA
jgi:hypothetical protein